MKTPIPPPPDADQLADRMMRSGRWSEVLDVVGRASGGVVDDRDHHPWEWFFRHEPPSGVTREEWWALIRSRRRQVHRGTPFRMKDGTPFTYNLPDRLLWQVEEISSKARGQLMLPDEVLDPRTRGEYLIRSLMEEAITSSQLEGASTSRVRAKELLRSNTAPRDRSERMIVNNYRVMTELGTIRGEKLTPELVLHIHRMVTDGTLDDPRDAGRLQGAGEPRVRVYGSHDEDQVLHVPPPAEELPRRLEILCEFANASDSGAGAYMPPLLRAFTLHFMAGYDHYFVDGNGRTSRALFYWAMLNRGFFLAEFLPISRLLRAAPAKYARAFLHTEQDAGDLTHFFLHQAGVVMQAITDFDDYLMRKVAERSAAVRRLRGSGLNHRQVAVVDHLMRDEGAAFTVEGHRVEHGVVPQTARSDLRDLESRGLLSSTKVGRQVVWFVGPEFERLMRG